MRSEQATFELDEVLASIIDHRGRTPKKLGGDFTADGVRVISAKDVKAGRLSPDGGRCVSREMYEHWMPNKLVPGDVLLTSEAPLGEVALVTGDTPLCLGQRLFALRADPERLDGGYLFYSLQGTEMQQRLQARASGTTATGIRQAELRKVQICLPPLREQSRIAWVLGSLDDKIELNRRIAETLEQIAAAVFKARFVDFVGVEEFEESELGPIPKWWTVHPLAEFVDEVRDTVKGEREEPYIGLDAMPRGSTVLSSWAIDDAPDGSARLFRRGDILFGKLRPYFRKVGPAPLDGRSSTEIVVLRANTPSWGFVLGHLASDGYFAHCESVSRGTRMPRAEWKDAGSYPVAVPPVGMLSNHNDLASACYEVIFERVIQNRTLTALRDALLPKLISGELRVPEGVGPDLDPEAAIAGGASEQSAGVDWGGTGGEREDPAGEAAAAAT